MRLPTIVTRCPVPDDPRSVTRVRPDAEVPPEEVGLDPETPDRIWRRVERLYSSGIHPAIQLCLRRRGQVVLDRSIGHARGNGPTDLPDAPKEVCTPDTLFNIFSASKAITAMVIHHLDENHLVHIDDPVCEYIPEFARHGKHGITIRHVLEHRAGIPNLPADTIDMDRLGDDERTVSLLCDAEPAWPPGRVLAYHAITGGFVLGEVVRRVTGRDIRTYLREEILAPLGFQWTNYGVAPEHVDRVARNEATGAPLPPPFGWLLERALSLPVDEVTKVSNDPRFLRAVIPAGNVITTANELSRFFEMLRMEGELDGVRVFDRRTVRRARSEQSYLEIDFTLGFPIRYGLGFILGARTLSLYGPGTEHAFGHLGFTNVIAWADPEREVSGTLMTSGKPVLYPELGRLWSVMSTIAGLCPRDRAWSPAPGA